MWPQFLYLRDAWWNPPVKPALGNGPRSDFYFLGLNHSLLKSIPASLISKKVEVDCVLPTLPVGLRKTRLPLK